MVFCRTPYRLVLFCCCSARRGYMVYKQVCSACHSLNGVRFREMVGIIFTEDEAKADAAEVKLKRTTINTKGGFG